MAGSGTRWRRLRSPRTHDGLLGERTTPGVGIVVTVAGVVIMAALSWQAAGHLADPVVLAGAGRDGADQYASKALVLSGAPMLTAALGVLLVSTRRLRLLWMGRDERTQRKAVDLALGVLTPVLLSMHLLPAPMVSLAVSMAVLVMAAVPLATVWWSVMRPGR